MRKRILVVDDDPDISEGLQMLLEGAGYEVGTCEDGEFLKWRFDTNKPDVILLDFWLPNMNGGDITKVLKHRADTKDIPVIIISASMNVRKQAKDFGADDFISKPYDISEVLMKVAGFLNL